MQNRLSQTFNSHCLKHFTSLYRFSLPAVILLVAAGANGQDVHFAQVQDMGIWYNPALKTNREVIVHANIRNVKYQDITAYTSKAASIELPITIDSDKKESNTAGFTDLAAGMTASSSTGGTMNVSTAMLALSYAVPLDNDNNTYLAAGFQASYTFSRITYNGYNSFPDELDPYGPISTAVSADPYGSGYTYQYFTAGAGIAFFHNDENKQWFIGSSVRHLNRPLTDPTQPDSYRLPMNFGFQASYTKALNAEDGVGGYGYFTWQKRVHEHVIGAQYTRNLGDSASSAVYLNTGYRIGDALIPGFGFRTGKNRFTFCYEFSISGDIPVNYNRRAFEFSYTLNL